MSAEIEVALAQLFRKKGKSILTEKDFVFAASLDLRWFNPKEAQKFLEIGLESELVTLEEGKIHPTFDYQSTVVPSGYTPSPELLKTAVQPKGIFLKLVDEISKEREVLRREVISLINKTQDRMGIDVEVATLIVARAQGIDITAYLDDVEEEVAARYRDAD